MWQEGFQYATSLREPEPRMMQEWVTFHSEVKFNNIFHTLKELGHLQVTFIYNI